MCGSSGTRAMRVIGARSRAASPPELMTLLLSPDADLTYLVEMLPNLPASGVPVSTCSRALAGDPCWGASTQLGLRTRWKQGGNGVVSQKKDFGRGLKAETERTWKTPGRECA
jgi:hypothetical protein